MSLANKAFSVLVRDILLFVSNLITAIVVARHLGPDLFGIWAIINLVPSYIDMLFRSKADIAAVYFLGKKKYGIGDITVAIHLFALASSVIAILPFLFYFDAFSSFLLKDVHQEYSTYLLLVLIVIPLNFIYLNYMYLHTHHEDASKINSMVLSRFLLSSLITIILLLVFDAGLFGLIIATICGLTVSVLIGIFNFKHEKPLGPLINIKVMKALILYSYKIYISGLLINLNSYIAQIFVISYASPANFAFYSIAQQFCLLLEKIISSLNLFLFPRISKGSHKENIVLTARAFRIAILIMLSAFLLSIIFIYPAVNILYGYEYIQVVNPFLIMLPGIVLLSIAGVFSSYFHGVGRAEIIAYVSSIPILIQLALGFIMVPLYGIQGAALILSIGLTISAIAQFIFFKSLTNVPLKKMLFVTYEDIKIITDFIASIIKKIIYKT